MRKRGNTCSILLHKCSNFRIVFRCLFVFVFFDVSIRFGLLVCLIFRLFVFGILSAVCKNFLSYVFFFIDFHQVEEFCQETHEQESCRLVVHLPASFEGASFESDKEEVS